MKRLLAIAFALFAVSTAQAQQKTTAQIKNDITTLFPTTGAGLITANQLRQVTNEMADSYVNKGDATSVVDVAAFGAVGNGSTDDTAAIQAAITAAAGRQINFGNKQYLVSCAGSCNIFTSSTPVNIKGQGNGAGPGAVLNSPATQFLLNCSGCNLFYITSAYSSKFEDFQVNVNPGFRPHAGIGINLDAPSTNTVQQPIIRHVAFQNVNTPIRIMRPSYPDISGNYFQAWINHAVYLETSLGTEGSGGFVHHNFFFGVLPLNTSSPIYSEVGYTDIHDNEILGGNNGVEFSIKNNDAGWIKVHDNTIENWHDYGISIASGDGHNASMVMLEKNEFSSIDGTGTTSIGIIENNTLCGWSGTTHTSCAGAYNTGWISDIQITGNISRNILSSSGRHFWVQAGKNVNISGNTIDDLGTTTPYGIAVSGTSTNAGLITPFNVFDNTMLGITVANKYNFASNPSAVLRDLNGLTLAALPQIGNGSQIFITDGNPASAPCTSGGTGAMLFKVGNVLRCY